MDNILPFMYCLLSVLAIVTVIMILVAASAVKRYNAIYQKCEEYKETVDNTNQIKEENAQLKRVINRNADYNKTVMQQVGDIISKHPNWGFGNDCPFPGATVVQVDPVATDDENFVVVKMKTEFEPIVAERILNEPDPRKRYSIALRSLQLQGVIERIARALINTCAIQYSLAAERASEGNTKIYICYQIAAKQYDDSTMIDLSKAGDEAAESE